MEPGALEFFIKVSMERFWGDTRNFLIEGLTILTESLRYAKQGKGIIMV